MKFGKYIQKKQLEIPEFAPSFVNYKGLKKLIKGLARSPIPEHGISSSNRSQATLQDNRATFFFKLDQELYKVNEFYKLKEAEAKIRIGSLIEKQRSLRMRIAVISRDSSNYISLEQGFKDFIEELHKLEQFMEINGTAFSKILKKWDKLSKSQTREVYLSRAYEVQPGFNREVISELQDQANSALLDCEAWAEGDDTTYGTSTSQPALQAPRLEQDETDSDLLEALNKGEMSRLTCERNLIWRVVNSENPAERLSKAFLAAISTAPDDALQLILDTGMVDMKEKDDINARNSLHKAAMSGRTNFAHLALVQGVDPKGPDAYGRTPIHYACMNGHMPIIDLLMGEHAPGMLDLTELNGHTPLICAIMNGNANCVEKLLQVGARVDRAGSEGQIPLNLACKHGNFEIISMLLKRKPMIIPDAEGLFPQHTAAHYGCEGKTFVRLREHGAHLDQADKLYGWTPLFHAAEAGQKETMRALLDLKVDPTVLDEKGLTAQYYAIWEGHLDCMALLAEAVELNGPPRQMPLSLKPIQQGLQSAPATGVATPAIGNTIDAIPDLSLGPPMVPPVKWGHNFLKDQKTMVSFNFIDGQRKAVTFYDPGKYPAARLTIVPKFGNITSRTISLPFTEDNRNVAFEMDDFANFAVDFDVYPTFGKTLIAKGSVPAEVFCGARTSSGLHHLALFDPRLRSIGELMFQFQVIKPFPGEPLDPKQTYLYWKATSNISSTNLNTGSSLSGQYIRLYVQLSSDGIPVLYPYWTIQAEAGMHAPVLSLSYDQFQQIGAKLKGTDRPKVVADACSNPDLLPQTEDSTDDEKKVPNMENLRSLHRTLASSFTSLASVLQMLPLNVQVDIHVMYPTPEEEEAAFIRPKYNLNETVDKIVKEVFDHARALRSNSGHTRGIVFTSYNRDLCTALNWKQPNFPVLLCNDLGAPSPPYDADPYDYRITSDGKSSMSIKEAVCVAETNNLMGLVCRSQILDMVPALINAIKHAGLVLVSDTSGAKMSSEDAFQAMPEGADGILMRNGVMHYNKTHDM